MKVRNILVPTDFSEHAEAAFTVAREFARTFGARIQLLHVYDIPDLASVYELTFPAEVDAGIRKVASRKLEDWKKRAAAEGIETSTCLEFGRPSRAIVEHARESKSDLIVIGTRGLGALKQLLLGSVAERTIRTAPCTVLTVGSDATMEPPGLESSQ